MHTTEASGPRRMAAQVPEHPDQAPQTYPFSAYDRNLCLKMNAPMWAALAFSPAALRHRRGLDKQPERSHGNPAHFLSGQDRARVERPGGDPGDGFWCTPG